MAADDEDSIGVRTNSDNPDDPTENEAFSEAAFQVALNTIDDLLRRVQRVEEHLGIGSTGSQATPIAKEINDLKASVSRLAQNIGSSSVSRKTDRQIEPATPRGPKSEPLPGRVGPPSPPKRRRSKEG
jgi:hypothetical protein